MVYGQFILFGEILTHVFTKC